MCDLCKKITEKPNTLLMTGEPRISTFYWIMKYLSSIEFPINFCPYCGECFSNAKTRRPTGLADYTGQPLYEGDIVETKYGRYCKIVWFSSPSHYGWDLEPYANLDKKPPDYFDMWLPENLTFIEREDL